MRALKETFMRDLLKKHFGYDDFRPLQGEIINHVAAGQDALVLMPTGGGKSLCYQLPALARPGVAIVISPLIALMKDQVDALRANGISAAYLNSSVSFAENARVEQQVLRGEIKLLYLAPERVSQPQVQDFLKRVELSLIAIDEAHCISEWGHDFRPDYRSLKLFRTLFPKTPLVALTATANERVRNDIIHQLGLGNARIFQSSFNRPNLMYRVQPKKQALKQLLQEIHTRPNQAIIIYCFSRSSTEKVVADLRTNGIKAIAYHAGLSAIERSRIQEQFITDQVPIIAATIAFGMGIDKPDVRLVVHMDLPKSVEGYYQETGRAGRDGLPSDCLLFFSNGDRFKQEYFIRDMANPLDQARARHQLQQMCEYGELKTCRREYLLRYFGETTTGIVCQGCDICVPRQEINAESDAETAFDKDLFEILRTTRRTLAEAKKVPPYVIFGDKTLQEMAHYFPQSLTSLSRIFGIGKEKLAKYGELFLQDIVSYAKTNGIHEKPIFAASVKAPTPTKTNVLSSTVQKTLELFEEKRSIEQIAFFRELSVGTILSHLEEALEQGKKLDIAHLAFPSIERFGKISAAFEQAGTTMLTPVRAELGEDFSYDEIRFVRFMQKAQKL